MPPALAAELVAPTTEPQAALLFAAKEFEKLDVLVELVTDPDIALPWPATAAPVDCACVPKLNEKPPATCSSSCSLSSRMIFSSFHRILQFWIPLRFYAWGGKNCCPKAERFEWERSNPHRLRG
jgi:hypothetical protein